MRDQEKVAIDDFLEKVHINAMMNILIEKGILTEEELNNKATDMIKNLMEDLRSISGYNKEHEEYILNQSGLLK